MYNLFIMTIIRIFVADQTRSDKLWKNVDNIPEKLKKRHRGDKELGNVLKDEHVASLTQLREKYRGK